MNNSVHIARAMLLIFIVSVIGSCSSTKSLFSKEYLMTHNDTTVYDNVYLVDTIEIPNPQVISFGCPGDYTDYSFLADSAIVMRIIDEFQNLHTWSDCLKYLKNENSLINSCYVYWISNFYDTHDEGTIISGMRRNRWISVILKPFFEERITIVGDFDGHPIWLCRFPNDVQKFILLLANVGHLKKQNSCLDCFRDKYSMPPTIMPYNKYIKIVYPVSPE